MIFTHKQVDGSRERPASALGRFRWVLRSSNNDVDDCLFIVFFHSRFNSGQGHKEKRMFIDCKTELEWLAHRVNYLTASDAGNYTGLNPYDQNGMLHLWEEKVGLRKRADISEKPAVKFGKTAEEHIRALFMLMHPEYTLQYDPFGLYVSDDHPFMAATLDGLLLNNENASHEIFEAKTGTVRTKSAWDAWNSGELPINYWCQILHQSECVKWAGGIWVVGLITKEWEPDRSTLFMHHYDVRDPEFVEDRKKIVGYATDMWKLIQTRRRPNMAFAI